MGGQAAYGAQLKMGDGATPTEEFTTIADVKDISGPGVTRDMVDGTTHSSEDGYKEKVPTLKDGGDVTFELNWDPRDGTHDMTTGLGAKVEADEPTNFQLIYARVGFQWNFAGYVTAFGPVSAAVAGLLTAPVTIAVTGKPQLVTGS